MPSSKYSRLDPAQRRDQILDTANALFAERAYDEVSVEDIAGAAGVTRGLVHHYFGGRKDVYIGLLERIGAQREDELRSPEGRSARARVADTVSRWLDWTEANRTIWLATMAHGEAIADPDVRHVVADLVRPRRRAARGLSRRHRRGLTATSLRARMLDRPQPCSDATLAGGRGHPRGHAGVAHLHARACPSHLRRAEQARTAVADRRGGRVSFSLPSRQSRRGASAMKRRSFPVDPLRSISSTSVTLT